MIGKIGLSEVQIGLKKIEDLTSFLTVPETKEASHFSRRRKFEFSTGRYLARELIGRLNIEAKDIMRDDSGCPIWPEGVLGSITHKNRLCIVAVTTSKKYKALGVDLEEIEHLDQGVWKVFTSQNEITHLRQLGLDEPTAINTIFAIKESLYKCAYNLFFDQTPSFIEEKIKFLSQNQSVIKSECAYNSLIFKVNSVVLGSNVLSVAYV